MGWFKTPDEKEARRKARLSKKLFSREVDKVRRALEAGAEPDLIRNDSGFSAITFHAEGGREDIVTLLIEHGGNPDFPGSSGHTALMAASRGGRLSLVKLLCEKGANVDAQSDSGWTPLHNAAYWGRGPVMEYLLERGADAQKTDNRMNTPADIATKEGYPRIADWLEGRVATPEPEPQQPAAQTGWQKTAADEIARISEKPAIGYRMTEIFNFSAAQYTHIAANLATGAESQHQRDFDSFSEQAMLRQAMDELLSRGGDVPADMKSKLSGKAYAAPRGLAQGGSQQGGRCP
jgi:hypothetical protein